MELAIVGWRKMKGDAHQQLFNDTLERFVVEYGLPKVVISGGAAGADTMGEKWAKMRKIPTKILKPQWKNAQGVYDKAAGIKRNTDIVAACTHMVAFPSDQGRGTQDSILKARKSGKIVMEIKLKDATY